MIDRLQKWVKCNFPSPLIGIHGQPHWQLGVSGFTVHDSKAPVRLGFLNTGIVQYHVFSPYCTIKYGITLWRVIYSQLGTTCELHQVWEWFHLVDTAINLVYSLVYIEHGYSAYCCVGAGSSSFTQSVSLPLLEAVESG